MLVKPCTVTRKGYEDTSYVFPTWSPACGAFVARSGDVDRFVPRISAARPHADVDCMLGPLVGSAAALVAASAAVAGHSLGSLPASRTTSPFGGSAVVHLTHVGRIEVDLHASRPLALRRVGCIGASSPATTCFVARH